VPPCGKCCGFASRRCLRTLLAVVPANAGTHNHRVEFVGASWSSSLRKTPSCGYGSRIALASLACPARPQVLPRHKLPEVLQIRCPSLVKRAQGKPGADCARSPVCEGSGRKHTG